MEKDRENQVEIIEFLNFFPKRRGGLRDELEKYFINNSEDWVNFKKEFSQIMRWSDLNEDIRPKESNFDHVLEMYQISRELKEKFPAEFSKLDEEKLLAMIGLHDIGELNKEGDIPTGQKHIKGNEGVKRQADRRENIAAYVVLKKIKDEDLRNKLELFLEEYEERISAESIIVKLIDIIQAYRKYSQQVISKFDGKKDQEVFYGNIIDIQIPQLIEKGIRKIRKDFPGIANYAKEDFLDKLALNSKKFPKGKELSIFFKNEVEGVMN